MLRLYYYWLHLTRNYSQHLSLESIEGFARRNEREELELSVSTFS